MTAEEKVKRVYPDAQIIDNYNHGWVIKADYGGSVLTTYPHFTKDGAWSEVAEWILKTPETPEQKHDTRTAKARLQEMRSNLHEWGGGVNPAAVLDSLLDLLIEMEGWKA
jgi:hypothetical protein